MTLNEEVDLAAMNDDDDLMDVVGGCDDCGWQCTAFCGIGCATGCAISVGGGTALVVAGAIGIGALSLGSANSGRPC
jgi:hypothetical protein